MGSEMCIRDRFKSKGITFRPSVRSRSFASCGRISVNTQPLALAAFARSRTVNVSRGSREVDKRCLYRPLPAAYGMSGPRATPQ